MTLAIPANPTLNPIAAFVSERVNLFNPLAVEDVAEGSLEVPVRFGCEILLKLVVEAPGMGTITVALAP